MPKWLLLKKDFKTEKAGKKILIEKDDQAQTLIDLDHAEACEDPTKDIVAELGKKMAEDRKKELEEFGAKVAQDTVAKLLKANADARAEKGGRPNIVVKDPNEYDDPKFGFKTFGEQLLAVKNHVLGAGTDERLTTGEKAIRTKAPTNFAAEGVGADGGFTVAPDYNAQILQYLYTDESLLPRCRNLTTVSNSLTIPKDETVPWGTDGVQAYWTGETGTITDSKPKLGELQIKLDKLSVLVPVSNELLEDSAVAVGQYIMGVAPQKIADKVNGAIFSGTGSGMPLGFYPSGAAIQQAKDSGQSANTVTIGNITNMLSKIPSWAQRGAVWLVHSTTLPLIYQLQIGNYPVFIPPGGAVQSPSGMLMGKPLIITEQANALTSKADISLVDLSNYIAVTKSSGLRSDMSVHIYFDRDVSAFRFVFRLGGQPWMQNPITQKNGGGTISPFVYLQNR